MLVVACAALPVAAVVAMDPGGWYPFGPAKWAVVSVVVALVVVGLGRQATLRLPRWSSALWAGFLALVVLSALTGVDGRYAWLGTPERHFGALTWIAMGVCFIAGGQLSASDLRTIARGGALAAAWAGAYAVVELMAGAPIELEGGTDRLGGPFGSAAYLGAMCCLLVPIAASVAMDRRTPTGWRAVGTVGALTGSVAIAGSGARAAWLALAMAVAVAVAVAPARRRVALAAAACVLVGFVAVAPRLGAVSERSSGASSRLDEWSVAARVIGEHPLLGVGPEGYRIAFAGGVDATYERRYDREIITDRAHSGPLDVAAASGIPAGVTYVALLAAVAVAAGRWLRRGAVPGLAIGALAYLTQQLLLFPVAELDPTFWLVAGALVTSSARRVDLVSLPVITRKAVAVGGVAVVAVLVIVGTADVAADRLARRAVSALGTPTAEDDAGRAAALRPDVVRYHLLEAAAADERGTLAGTDRAIAAVDEALAWSPGDPVARRRQAELVLRRAEITGAPDDVMTAVEAWQVLVAVDRSCFACQLGLGRAALLADDVATAEQALLAAGDLTTTDPRPAELLLALRSWEAVR